VQSREGVAPAPRSQTIRAAVESTARLYTPSDWRCPDRCQHFHRLCGGGPSPPDQIEYAWSSTRTITGEGGRDESSLEGGGVNRLHLKFFTKNFEIGQIKVALVQTGSVDFVYN
jgi:hypothetical protein